MSDILMSNHKQDRIALDHAYKKHGECYSDLTHSFQGCVEYMQSRFVCEQTYAMYIKHCDDKLLYTMRLNARSIIFDKPGQEI